MKDTMILRDGTVIELEAGASLGDIRVMAADRAEVEYPELPIKEMAQPILEVGPVGPDTTVQRKGLGDPELYC